MVPYASLWLPIVLSAVAVFLASSILHMVLPWHKGDCQPLAQEAALRAALGPLQIPPGDYMVPRPHARAEMRTDAFRQKMREGPVLVMTVFPNGLPQMGPQLAQWLVYCLAVSALAALLPSRDLGPGAPLHPVFHRVAFGAFLGYSVALWQFSIWYRRSWLTTLKSTVDGLIYAAITALVFAFLWPH